MKKIAIIGGGIAGVTAGYLLSQKYQVSLFERSERLGGNAYTLKTADGQEVDIAAAVFGKSSYKNLYKLFRKLHIETIGPSSVNPFLLTGLGVSFFDLDTRQGFYLTPGLRSLISQRFQILRPAQVKSILQLCAGMKKAVHLLRTGSLEGLSVEQALQKIPEMTGLAKLILVSCFCLITSMHCTDVLHAPASFFFEKISTHDDFIPPKALFSVRFSKQRTRAYIDALAAPYRDTVYLNERIKAVLRSQDHVTLAMENGRQMDFDRVVFACNADQALQLLQQPTPEEQRLLGAWRYTEGKVVVHRDHSSFPKRELMEGYTFLYRKTGRYLETSVSGSLWVLPGVSRKSDLISTQHPNVPLDRDLMLFEKVFRTPLFDFNACRSIRELPSLNGIRNTYYCGSHFGFGLHEDAVTSAINAAAQLGVEF